MLRYLLLVFLSVGSSLAFAEKSASIHVIFGGSTDKGTSEYDGDNTNYFINPVLIAAPMTCSGKNRAYYVASSKQVNDGQDLDIRINGIFNGDSRRDCKLKEDDPYFKINNLMVGFYYRGKYFKCNIDQGIGY